MQPKKAAHEVSCMAPQPPLPFELLEKDSGGSCSYEEGIVESVLKKT